MRFFTPAQSNPQIPSNLPNPNFQYQSMAPTLDSIFNAYMASKQQAGQDGVQRLTQGFTNEEATPERVAMASQPAPQGPVQPGQAPMEEGIVTAMRLYKQRMQAGQQAQLQGNLATAQEKQSQVGLNDANAAKARAEASAMANGQVYFDPQTGRQIVVPHGAKPLPAGSGQEGKMLPPASVLNLNEGAAVARQLPDVAAALDEAQSIMGPVGGRQATLNPYNTKAQTIDARFRTASQAFGRFMEGGVLRKEDEEKYRKMFPQLIDTSDVAKNKLSIVQRLLAQKYESDKGALKGSGYDVSGLGSLDIPQSLFGGGVQEKTLKDGTKVRVRKNAQGQWEEI